MTVTWHAIWLLVVAIAWVVGVAGFMHIGIYYVGDNRTVPEPDKTFATIYICCWAVLLVHYQVVR